MTPVMQEDDASEWMGGEVGRVQEGGGGCDGLGRRVGGELCGRRLTCLILHVLNHGLTHNLTHLHPSHISTPHSRWSNCRGEGNYGAHSEVDQRYH